MLQLGGEFGNVRLGDELAFYSTVDIKSREEVSWAPTWSFQMGARMLVFGPHAVHFVYTYRTGAEERGQFYTQPATVSLLGVFLDS